MVCQATGACMDEPSPDQLHPQRTEDACPSQALLIKLAVYDVVEREQENAVRAHPGAPRVGISPHARKRAARPAPQHIPHPARLQTIVRLNNFTRSLGVGGIFHGAVVVESSEWSFGACERGSGVYACGVSSRWTPQPATALVASAWGAAAAAASGKPVLLRIHTAAAAPDVGAVNC